MSTRNLPEGKERPACKADNLTPPLTRPVWFRGKKGHACAQNLNLIAYMKYFSCSDWFTASCEYGRSKRVRPGDPCWPLTRMWGCFSNGSHVSLALYLLQLVSLQPGQRCCTGRGWEYECSEDVPTIFWSLICVEIIINKIWKYLLQIELISFNTTFV
jgi:hypothetical protein